MTPMFDPGPNRYGPPRVLLAAVGPRMAEVAGEVADGIIVHAFTTERYHDYPLIVRGAGAGGDVTAAGVLADVLRLAQDIRGR